MRGKYLFLDAPVKPGHDEVAGAEKMSAQLLLLGGKNTATLWRDFFSVIPRLDRGIQFSKTQKRIAREFPRFEDPGSGGARRSL